MKIGLNSYKKLTVLKLNVNSKHNSKCIINKAEFKICVNI